MTREADQIAQDYSAMLNSVNVIESVLDAKNDFYNDHTNTEKQERILRSCGYLEHMVALKDWGSEDMSTVNAAIKTAKAYDPAA
jgi:lipid II:glycine glycyltransferase (peptidoglycan interpeptide bridge formation enzyme)